MKLNGSLVGLLTLVGGRSERWPQSGSGSGRGRGDEK